MGTDTPAERLHRLFGGDPDENRDAAAQSGDTADAPADTRALMPSWIPDGTARRGQGWRAAVRADPGRAGAIALGVVAAVAVLVTVFTLVRAQPAPVVSANLPAVQAVSATPVPSGSESAQAAVSLVVSVVGLVATPGVVTLAPGARVADAVAAAGGVLDGSDEAGLNLARRLADGEQVVVGMSAPPNGPAVLGSSVTGGAPDPGAPADSSGAPQSPDTPLDLNTATAAQLDELPGVGPVTAAAIIAWRDQNGAFRSVDQLGDVDGIGPARLEKLRELVRV
jgi:competence protein ComEA